MKATKTVLVLAVAGITLLSLYALVDYRQKSRYEQWLRAENKQRAENQRRLESLSDEEKRSHRIAKRTHEGLEWVHSKSAELMGRGSIIESRLFGAAGYRHCTNTHPITGRETEHMRCSVLKNKLIVIQHPKYGEQVLLHAPGAQVQCSSSCEVSVRFGSDEIRAIRARPQEQNITFGAYQRDFPSLGFAEKPQNLRDSLRGDALWFISQLSEHDRIRIEVPVQGKKEVIEFLYEAGFSP